MSFLALEIKNASAYPQGVWASRTRSPARIEWAARGDMSANERACFVFIG